MYMARLVRLPFVMTIPYAAAGLLLRMPGSVVPKPTVRPAIPPTVTPAEPFKKKMFVDTVYPNSRLLVVKPTLPTEKLLVTETSMLWSAPLEMTTPELGNETLRLPIPPMLAPAVPVIWMVCGLAV